MFRLRDYHQALQIKKHFEALKLPKSVVFCLYYMMMAMQAETCSIK
jgi:hypothetical protein